MTSQEDTICYKVTRCMDMIENSIKTQTLNIYQLSKWLHQIRQDATNMEDGLRARKALMEKHNLEEEYQKSKGKQYKGVNKIAMDEIVETKDLPTFEVTVKDKNGEIMYQNKVHAGVFSFVEEIQKMDETGAIYGQTQKMTFGHDLAVWFAFDQLKQAIEDRGVRIIGAIHEQISKGVLNRRARRDLLKTLRRQGVKK